MDKRVKGYILFLVLILTVLTPILWMIFCRVTIPEGAACYFVYPYNGGGNIDSQRIADSDAIYLRELLNGKTLFPNLTLLGEDQRFVDTYYLEFQPEQGGAIRFYIPRSASADGSFAINKYFCASYGFEIGGAVFDVLKHYDVYGVSVR